jgi:hypothetical protein
MTNEDLESRVRKLETKTRKLKASLEHSTAVLEIMNLQSMYNHVLGSDHQRIWTEYFAHKYPHLKDEVVESGVFEGLEEVTRKMESGGFGPAKIERGFLGLIYSLTPCVVVDKDGKTAKGVWHMWGPHGMTNTPYPGDERKMVAYWFIGKYSNEFVKEDGRWKCFSRQVISYIRTPYDQGWLRQPDCRRIGAQKDAQPPSVLMLRAPYHPDGVFYPIPAPPEPEE